MERKVRYFLRLVGFGGDKWAVEHCALNGTNEPDSAVIGTVTKNRHNPLWAAHDTAGANHGDCYLDRWCAARQLALGLKLNVEGVV